jgi:hypothetical protein
VGAELDEVDPAYEDPVLSEPGDPTINTFNFTTYDPANRLGAVLCLNSMPGDASMWRHGVLGFHPSGDVLVSKGFARGGPGPAFGTANLKYRCERPFQRWRVIYDGVVHRLTSARLRDAVAVDAPDLPMSFELTFEAIVPAWGHVVDPATGFHYEQNGRMTGWWRCGDETWDYDGVGFRDRIVGPKDTAAMHGHNWFNGIALDGRAFALTMSTLRDDPTVVRGNGLVSIDGSIHATDILDVPLWVEAERDPHPFEITLRSPIGEHVIRLQPLQSLPWTYLSNHHSSLQSTVFGHDRSRSGALLLWESPCRLDWDGVGGHGHIEQSLLVP